VVTGVRASEQQSSTGSATRPSIQDSIAAEDMASSRPHDRDSLQRITGVQINREGGEGTTVNIRGLLQVGTRCLTARPSSPAVRL
jgi:outer membrane cobalamin receptor